MCVNYISIFKKWVQEIFVRWVNSEGTDSQEHLLQSGPHAREREHMSEMLLAASSTSLAHILIDESLLNKMQKERMEKKRKEERGEDKERREYGTCLPILEEASNCPSSSLPSSLWASPCATPKQPIFQYCFPSNGYPLPIFYIYFSSITKNSPSLISIYIQLIFMFQSSA